MCFVSFFISMSDISFSLSINGDFCWTLSIYNSETGSLITLQGCRLFNILLLRDLSNLSSSFNSSGVICSSVDIVADAVS